jgi:hypothetical protein
MTAAFEMTLETLSLNRPYHLNEVGLRGKSSLFNSAWMRAPSQTCNGQVGYRLLLLSGLRPNQFILACPEPAFGSFGCLANCSAFSQHHW